MWWSHLASNELLLGSSHLFFSCVPVSVFVNVWESSSFLHYRIDLYVSLLLHWCFSLFPLFHYTSLH